MKFTCRYDLLLSRQDPQRNLLRFPLSTVMSHDLILSHTSFSEDAKNSKQDLVVGLLGDTLGAEKQLSPSKAALPPPHWQKISQVSTKPQETRQAKDLRGY